MRILILLAFQTVGGDRSRKKQCAIPGLPFRVFSRDKVTGNIASYSNERDYSAVGSEIVRPVAITEANMSR